MSSNGQPYNGPLTIDVTALAGLLIDLPPGRKHGLRPEKEGLAAVIIELAAAMPSAAGPAAGVPEEAYKLFLDNTEKIAKIRALRPVVDKLAEVIDETEALLVNDRENAVGRMVDAATSTARRKKDPSLLAPFEKTLAYNGQIAEKAVKTRKKNAAAKKAKGGG